MKFGKFIEIKGDQAADFGFLVKAISDDETRYFMDFAFCEDNKLIAIDGRRLHIVDLGNNIWEFKDKKFYVSLKALKKTVWFAELEEAPGQFPNYERVIPDTSEFKTINYSSSKQDKHIQYAKLIRAIPEDLAINLDYINDLPINCDWICSIGKEYKPIVFESGNMKAVIMPMMNQED